jgi:hypothetical protein
MRRILLTLGSATLVTAAGIPVATAVSAAPMPATPATAVPAQAPCLPVPAVGLACGALGAVPGGSALPDFGQMVQKLIENRQAA